MHNKLLNASNAPADSATTVDVVDLAANWFITVTLPDVSLETITEYDAMLVDS